MPPVAFLCPFGTSTVNQHLAHDVRCDAQKVRPIPKCEALAVEQAEVGFVHQRAGFRSAIKAVMPHLNLSHAAQFAVNQGSELGKGGFVSLANSRKQFGNI